MEAGSGATPPGEPTSVLTEKIFLEDAGEDVGDSWVSGGGGEA